MGQVKHTYQKNYKEKNMKKTYEITTLGKLILKDESRIIELVKAKESEYPDLREFELIQKWKRDDRLEESDRGAGI
jgi:hypothetical protein